MMNVGLCPSTITGGLRKPSVVLLLFQDPPENMFEQEVDNSRKRKVGAGGFLQEKLVGTGDKKEDTNKSKKERDTSAASAKATKEKRSSSSKSEQTGARKVRKSAKQLRAERKKKASV